VEEGYVQQCAAGVIVASDASADVRLTAKTDVAIVGLPVVPNSRQISGTVHTIMDGQGQPLVGASVGWEMDMDTIVAETVTDTQGHYRLCGMPKDRISGLYAVKVGSWAFVYTEVADGADAVINFDVP